MLSGKLYVYQVEQVAEPKIPFGYRYLVQQYSMAHTAFVTEAEMKLWAKERGLTLPERGTDGYVRGYIGGEYGRRYFNDEQAFYALSGQPILELDNGSYTLGLITIENGLNWVNLLNPNVRQRPDFDYKSCRKLEQLGVNPFAALLHPQDSIERFRQAFRLRVWEANIEFNHLESIGEANSLRSQMMRARGYLFNHNRVLFLSLREWGIERDEAYMLARRTGAGEE